MAGLIVCNLCRGLYTGERLALRFTMPRTGWCFPPSRELNDIDCGHFVLHPSAPFINPRKWCLNNHGISQISLSRLTKNFSSPQTRNNPLGLWIFFWENIYFWCVDWLRYFESIGNISFDGFKYFFFLNFSNFIGVTYISMDFPIGLVSFKFERNMTESRKWNSRKITQ